MKLSDHIVILIGFVSALTAFTVLSITGSDSGVTLHDVIVGLGGALAGVAVAKSGS